MDVPASLNSTSDTERQADIANDDLTPFEAERLREAGRLLFLLRTARGLAVEQLADNCVVLHDQAVKDVEAGEEPYSSWLVTVLVPAMLRIMHRTLTIDPADAAFLASLLGEGPEFFEKFLRRTPETDWRVRELLGRAGAKGRADIVAPEAKPGDLVMVCKTCGATSDVNGRPVRIPETGRSLAERVKVANG